MRLVDIRENASTIRLAWEAAEALAEGMRRAAGSGEEGGEGDVEGARRSLYYATMLWLQAAALASRSIPDPVVRKETDECPRRLAAQWQAPWPPGKRGEAPPAA